jgi:hypothetical protein
MGPTAKKPNPLKVTYRLSIGAGRNSSAFIHKSKRMDISHGHQLTELDFREFQIAD